MSIRDIQVDLEGKVAVITGGARGLGLTISRTLGRAGAVVTIVDKDENALSQAKESLKDSGLERVETIAADLTDVSQISRVFRTIETTFGKLDILVNNAGVNVPKPSLEITERDWDLMQAVNLKATFFCCCEAAKLMLRQGKGRIVNIASQLGLVGAPERAGYCATKGGVILLTRSLAVEWARLGVNVNAVAPTFMRTEMTESVLADEAFYNSVISKIPMGRVAVPEDIAGGVLYLVSDGASMVTGHVLSIDGGYTAW
jgi:NAD(P)-dependent dehydrogenase (short-subunit alcohol dehydrogenase family)